MAKTAYIASLGLLAFGAGGARADALEKYHALTSVETHCATATGDGDIVICGHRRADQWRLPLIESSNGGSAGESVSAERNRLASEPQVRCGNAAILRNCGMAGVSMGASIVDGKLRARALAD